MFTGIIQEVGCINSMESKENGLRIHLEYSSSNSSSEKFSDIHIDESIAVNGICLTVVGICYEKKQIEFDVIEETIKKTTISSLVPQTKVNLERAMKITDRISGHWVQGHVDTTGKIIDIRPLTYSTDYHISFAREHREYLVPMGSITIDGISLTLAEVSDGSFKVSIIPYTLANTTLQYRSIGDFVNIEFDVIGKYISKYMKNYLDQKQLF